MQGPFHVEVTHDGQASLIAVSGELDLASSPGLEQEIARVISSDVEFVIVDLRALEFMDSTGLSTLVRAHQRIAEAGKRFALVRGPQQVQRLLNLTGVEDRLTFADTPEELLDGV